MNDEQFNLLDWIIIAVIIGAIIFILKIALLFGIWGFGVIGAVLGVFGIIRFLEKTSSLISKLLSPINQLLSFILRPFSIILSYAGPKILTLFDKLASLFWSITYLFAGLLLLTLLGIFLYESALWVGKLFS